jgi:hypothetical protein
MEKIRDTILSQYANSATIMALIDSMNQFLSSDVDLDNFYNFVWDVLRDGATLNDYGLDVWGRIVGVTRNLNIPAGITNPGGFTYTAGTYVLDNETFRTLILIKALANITACTAPSLNALLTRLFASRGRCYVKDTGNMTMKFTFEFYLLPYEYAIVAISGVIPHPAGVLVTIEQISSDTFGFENSGLQPFDQGTFFPN